MPTVKGMTQAAAEKELKALGLKVNVDEANDDTQPKGSVFDQSPEANTQVEVRARPSPSRCPRASRKSWCPTSMGLSVDTATEQLREVGLEIGEPEVPSPPTRPAT